MKGFRTAAFPLLLLLLLVESATAFLLSGSKTGITTTKLHGHISEWRDLVFEDVPGDLVGTNNNGEPVREVCILPFPLTDVLLQGETKELCLYEERFHKLFEKATTDHAGIVAMGFIAPPNGLLQGMPLCEIENYRTMEGDTGFGNLSILATIRVVGRATLLDVKVPKDEEGNEIPDTGYMTGWCREFTDTQKSSNSGDEDIMGVYNKLADECDDLFESILEMQEKIKSLEQQKQQSEKSGGDEKKEALSEATIRRMKLEAELELELGGDDDDDDDDDYLDDDDIEVTGPRSALQKAIQIAKASDTQGYTIVSSFSGSGNSGLSSDTQTTTKRSIQDLTALSWAYLSMDVWREHGDALFINLFQNRLRALNTVDLSERFMLVSEMLVSYKNILSKKLNDES